MHPISWLLVVAAWAAFLALAMLVITRLFPSTDSNETLTVRLSESVTISDVGGERYPAARAAGAISNAKTITALTRRSR